MVTLAKDLGTKLPQILLSDKLLMVQTIQLSEGVVNYFQCQISKSSHHKEFWTQPNHPQIFMR